MAGWVDVIPHVVSRSNSNSTRSILSKLEKKKSKYFLQQKLNINRARIKSSLFSTITLSFLLHIRIFRRGGGDSNKGRKADRFIQIGVRPFID